MVGAVLFMLVSGTAGGLVDNHIFATAVSLNGSRIFCGVGWIGSGLRQRIPISAVALPAIANIRRLPIAGMIILRLAVETYHCHHQSSMDHVVRVSVDR